MIELLIAMVIGLIVIGGLINVFIYSSNNYRVQQAQTQIQDNGRFVMRKLRHDIQRAGFQIEWDSSQTAIFWKANDAAYPVGAFNILELFWRDRESNSVNQFNYYLVDDSLWRNGIEDLTGALTVVPAVELAQNVMSLEYGFAADIDNEDESADIDWLPRPSGGIGSTAYFSGLEYTAHVATSSLSWNQVRAVSMDLVVASDTERVALQNQNLTEFNFDLNVSGALPAGFSAAQLRLHKGFRSTVTLRNRVK
jgi:Tfp pilus assembly protein PilW